MLQILKLLIKIVIINRTRSWKDKILASRDRNLENILNSLEDLRSMIYLNNGNKIYEKFSGNTKLKDQMTMNEKNDNAMQLKHAIINLGGK